MHLIDLANLLPDGVVSIDGINQVWQEYVDRVDIGPGDQIIVAVSMANTAAFFALPSSIRRLVGPSGADSAERALLDCVDPEWVARRFLRVVIASGKHAFVPCVHELTKVGVTVHLVLGAGHASSRLRASCATVTRLPLADAGRRPRERPFCARFDMAS